ncbi:hypothetical protein SEVIR_7G054950v4 [Setaria viridis]
MRLDDGRRQGPKSSRNCTSAYAMVLEKRISILESNWVPVCFMCIGMLVFAGVPQIPLTPQLGILQGYNNLGFAAEDQYCTPSIFESVTQQAPTVFALILVCLIGRWTCVHLEKQDPGMCAYRFVIGFKETDQVIIVVSSMK